MNCSKRRHWAAEGALLENNNRKLPPDVERVKIEMTSRPLSQLKKANQQLAQEKLS